MIQSAAPCAADCCPLIGTHVWDRSGQVLAVFTLMVVCMPLALLLLLGFGAVLLSGQGIGKKGLQYKIHRRQCSLIAPFSAAGLRVFLRDDGLVSQIKRCRDACFKRPGP